MMEQRLIDGHALYKKCIALVEVAKDQVYEYGNHAPFTSLSLLESVAEDIYNAPTVTPYEWIPFSFKPKDYQAINVKTSSGEIYYNIVYTEDDDMWYEKDELVILYHEIDLDSAPAYWQPPQSKEK